MDDDWLEIPDVGIDAATLMDRIRDRLAGRHSVRPSTTGEDPEAIADALWQEMIMSATDDGIPIRSEDCDIVPRNYAIDWRVPILGPIHALIRRIINAEIRRYLSSSLERQSYLNREILRALNDLVEENERLRREIEELRGRNG